MYAKRYIEEIDALTRSFAAEELDAVRRAAGLAVDAVLADGRLHHFDTGHMKREPIRRAGGLLALHHLELSMQVEHLLPAGREARLTAMEQEYFYDREDLAALLLDKSHVEAGDVLIQVSNSGKEPFTVGVALEARKRGLKVIALTSLAFSRSVASRHSSGQKLFEVADAVIDLHAPASDAVLKIDGIDTPVGATSGVMTAVALWCLMCETAGQLAEKGQPPAVYRSVNLPNGFPFNREQQKLYEERGF